MASFAASTPSPPSHIHSPTAPKHGFSDSWEPFSPRKSARLLAQRSSARTPSPPPGPERSQLKSPRQNKRIPPPGPMATPSSTSPRKRPFPATFPSQLASTSDANSNPTSRSQASNMLPTPAKTPQKQSSDHKNACIQSIARNLFSEADVLPSPRKRRTKKYTGLSLESFKAEDESETIQIYTDSTERIPEIDDSTDNPFYGESATGTTADHSRRQSKRPVVAIPGEQSTPVDDAVRRDDGILYVFRGKKVFRKFKDTNLAAEEEESEQTAAEDPPVDVRRQGPLTRSSLKPRLLFPPKTTPQVDTSELADEEALTDIEDDIAIEAHGSLQTPVDSADISSVTPKASKFTPASPPTSSRATRSASRAASNGTPLKLSRSGKKNPFDGWRRTKGGTASGQKRSGEPLGTDHPKRARA